MQSMAPGMHYQSTNLCKHCANYHSNSKQQQQFEQSEPPLQECVTNGDSITLSIKSTFVPFTTARKKHLKFIESSQNIGNIDRIQSDEHNEHNNNAPMTSIVDVRRLHCINSNSNNIALTSSAATTPINSNSVQKTMCKQRNHFINNTDSNQIGIDGTTTIITGDNIPTTESIILRSIDMSASTETATATTTTIQRFSSLSPNPLQRNSKYNNNNNNNDRLSTSTSTTTTSSNNNSGITFNINMTSTVAQSNNNTTSSNLNQSKFNSNCNSMNNNQQQQRDHLATECNSDSHRSIQHVNNNIHRHHPHQHQHHLRRCRCNSCISVDNINNDFNKIISGNVKQQTNVNSDSNKAKNKQKTKSNENRWPYAISSSTMKYSNVLLICIAFIVFGVRNAVVMADESPATTNHTNITGSGSKLQIFFFFD